MKKAVGDTLAAALPRPITTAAWSAHPALGHYVTKVRANPARLETDDDSDTPTD